MAKTIEERAIAFMNNYPNMDDSYYDYYVRDGYIQGAQDQDRIARQEERERCMEIYRNELTEIITLLNQIGEVVYKNKELGEVLSFDGCINDFRRALWEGGEV